MNLQKTKGKKKTLKAERKNKSERLIECRSGVDCLGLNRGSTAHKLFALVSLSSDRSYLTVQTWGVNDSAHKENRKWHMVSLSTLAIIFYLSYYYNLHRRDFSRTRR